MIFLFLIQRESHEISRDNLRKEFVFINQRLSGDYFETKDKLSIEVSYQNSAHTVINYHDNHETFSL